MTNPPRLASSPTPPPRATTPPPLAPAPRLGSDPSWANHQAWRLLVGSALFSVEQQRLAFFFSLFLIPLFERVRSYVIPVPFLLSLCVAAPALRTPLSIAGSYPTPFAMMGHHEMNGGLTSPGVYAGLHISPQMSAAAAAAYGRSPMVNTLSCLFKVNVLYRRVKGQRCLLGMHAYLLAFCRAPVCISMHIFR